MLDRLIAALRAGRHAVLVLAFAAPSALAQQVLPPALTQGPKSDVPVAIQALRWSMLDPNVSTLTFRSMDTLFTTRTVARSGPVWRLPRADHPLDFTYAYKGVSYTPGGGLGLDPALSFRPGRWPGGST